MTRTIAASIFLAVALGAACSHEVETETEEVAVEGTGAVVGESPSAAVEEGAPVDAEVSPRLLRRFQSLPQPVQPQTASEKVRVALGEKLFNDPGLSADGTVSCKSCHDTKSHGDDGEKTAKGVHGKRGTRNAPSITYSAGAFRQFWDGRADSLEEQAMGPLTNADEMGSTEASIVAYLKSQPSYRAEFAEAFPGKDSLSTKSVSKALAAYERTLPKRSRWDSFLDGDEKALSRDEKKGLRTFLNAGCMVCHTGPYLGAATFEKVGVVEPWPNQQDQGRFLITHNETDKMVFRVPGLRNVAETGPYFHDGSAATLSEAIHLMAKHQLGIDLTPEEVASIETWLKSLTEGK